ncbi:phytoene desaturase family protein [Cohnella sp. REN36]|uniref:phytoene desaturase family protein n=1 Tax=Cohnella sp. REN36 TaxID=2887347 RepID=UPI001D14DF4E|nr:phytoene desaturase [Cohnella sp. REN36]
MRKVVVIGAGLGGLSAAVRLAAAGFQVTVLEQQPEVGGKLQRIELGGYRFDRGPTAISMRPAFERVFASAGSRMEDYLKMYPLRKENRHIFADGTIIDLSDDPQEMEEQIAAYSWEDARQYRAFMTEAGDIYRAVGRLFDRLRPTWRDRADLRLMAGLLRFRPLTTLDQLLRRYFRHPNTLALFGRYATYLGSSPAKGPAVAASLAHLEAAIGVYGIKGGTYEIASGLRRLAEKLGAEIRTSVQVTRILSQRGTVRGVETEAGDWLADVIVANGDLLSVNRGLLAETDRPRLSNARIDSYEPSLSAFVLLAGVRKKFEVLRHHTVFYPPDYGREFDDIFQGRRPPSDPSLYVCFSGRSEMGLAPEGGSNLSILANAPYETSAWNWTEEETGYRDRLLRRLGDYGLRGIHREPEALSAYSPAQLRQDTAAYRGGIYGMSANSKRQALFRPSNRGGLRGLWFAGGTTQPGGSAMAALSGQMVAEHIIASYGMG